jgi:transposase-like protein
LLLETVRTTQARSGQALTMVLSQLGLPSATYYRWRDRAATGRLTDKVVLPHHQVLAPTPAEVEAVCTCALAHPAMGYKRLTWLMVDQEVAYLRPYQVYRLLG